MPIIKNCLECNKEFKVFFYRIKKGEGKYCSYKCSRKNQICTKETRIKMSNSFNKNCRKKQFKKGNIPWNKKDKIQKSCPTCDNKFYVHVYQIKNNRGKFCSMKCRRFSIEAKTKMSNSHKKLNKNRKGNHYNYKTGITFHNGYIFLFKKYHPFSKKSGYIAEHRFVVEKYIGRFLKTKYPVHHINKIKTDNRIKNLMCFSSNSAHCRFHFNPKNVKQFEIIFDGRKIV